MVIVRITGGLGNQLFQLGFAFYLSKKLNYKVKLDTSFYEDQSNFIYGQYLKSNKIPKREFHFLKNSHFAICSKDELVESMCFRDSYSVNWLNKVILFLGNFISWSFLMKLLTRNILTEKIIKTRKTNFIDGVIYSGYWQDTFFFKDFEVELKKNISNLLISNDFPLSNKNHLINLDSYIVMHIRKGDYSEISDYHSLGMQYYLDAFEIVFKKYTKIKGVHICTNDEDWCKKNIFFPGFEIKYSSRKSDMFSDFQIMHNSQFLVISNSTFSFWSGFLGNHDIVILPSLWYKNKPFEFIPKDWISLKVE